MRPKFVLIALAILCNSFATVFAQVSIPFSFSGPWNAISPIPGIFRSNADVYSGNDEAKLTLNGQWIKINFKATKNLSLTFSMKAYSTWAPNDNHLRVYMASSDLGNNETAWGTPISDFDNTKVGTKATPAGHITISPENSWIALFYTKVAQNIGITNIALTYSEGINDAMPVQTKREIITISHKSIQIFSASHNGTITLYDLMGHLVEKQQISQAETTLNIKSEGIYFVEIIENGVRTTKKVAIR